MKIDKHTEHTAEHPTPALDVQSPEYAAQFWRAVNAESGIMVKLPSGVTVRLRQYPLHELLKQDRLPKTLQAAALHVYNDGLAALDSNDIPGNIAFMDAVIAYCVGAPKLYDGQTPAPADALSVHEIPIRDRLHIFAWAMGNVRASQEIVPFSAPMTP